MVKTVFIVLILQKTQDDLCRVGIRKRENPGIGYRV